MGAAILAAIKIAQVVLPLGVELVMKFKQHPDGTISAETTFIQNGIKLDAGIAEGQAFLDSLKKP